MPKLSTSKRPPLFVEHQMTEETFAKLPHQKREIIQRYGIPMEAPKGFRRFKLTRHWSRQADVK